LLDGPLEEVRDRNGDRRSCRGRGNALRRRGPRVEGGRFLEVGEAAIAQPPVAPPAGGLFELGGDLPAKRFEQPRGSENVLAVEVVEETLGHRVIGAL